MNKTWIEIDLSVKILLKMQQKIYSSKMNVDIWDKIKRDEMIENIENQRLFEIQKESIKIFNAINNLGG